MAEVGWASLGIVPTFDKGFDAKLARGIDPALTRVGRDSGKRFGGVLGRSAAVAAGGAVAAGFAAFKLGKDAVESASTLNESLNAVNVTYGKQADAVKKLGEEASQALGLSNADFNALSVRFSAFSKTIAGGDGKAVVKTLDDLTTRSSDFASVMNLDVNEAATLFQSGLAGETEPLRRFGIDLSAAAVEAFAYANGIAKTGEELTESQKVQARYGSLMEQTAQTQGDFVNTSDELANQQRILSAEWENGKAKLGTALLPIMKDAVGFIVDEGIPAFEGFSDWFVKDGLPAIQDFADDVRPLGEELLPAVGDALGVAKDALEVAAPLASDLVGAFNDIPDDVKKFLLLMAGGAVVGSKAKGLFGGGKGGLLGGISKAAPLPVFVVNGGVGVGDGVGLGKAGKGGGAPKLLGLGKILGPIAAYALAYEFQKNFPSLSPFGSKGFLPGAGGLPELFQGDSDSPYTGLGRSIGSSLVPNGQALGSFETAANEKLLRPLLAAKGLLDDMPDDVVTAFSTPGLVETDRDVRKLIRALDLDLDKREVRTLIEVLGVDKAISDIDRILNKWNALERELGTDNIVPDLPGPGRSNQGGQVQGTGTGTTVNYNGPVTYNDSRERDREHNRHRRRSSTDNVNRGMR